MPFDPFFTANGGFKGQKNEKPEALAERDRLLAAPSGTFEEVNSRWRSGVRVSRGEYLFIRLVQDKQRIKHNRVHHLRESKYHRGNISFGGYNTCPR